MLSRSRIALLAILTLVPGCHEPVTTDPTQTHDVAATATSTTPEQRGRSIYTRGISLGGGAVSARVGQGPSVPASTLACVQCHGEDGRGRPEGGVAPSDITWPALTRPYGVTQSGGRRHPPYTPALFGRAVTMGWDPAGQDLSGTMPRYELSPRDLDDLIAYVRRLGLDPGVGLAGDVIRVGVAARLGADGTAEDRARVAELLALADEVNRGGGIFRRRLEWAFLRSGEGAFDPETVFATIGGFSPDDEAPASSAPSMAVFAPAGRGGPSAFAIASGYAGQAAALAEFLADNPAVDRGTVALIHGRSSRCSALAQTLARRLRDRGVSAPIVRALPSPDDSTALRDLAATIASETATRVLVVGPADPAGLLAFARESAQIAPPPTLLVPGDLASPLLTGPVGASRRPLVVAWPIVSAAGSGISSGHEARAAAMVLIEGLKRAGRSLDRDRFVAAMESLSEVETGITPRLTFGRARRVGARGARIVRVDPGSRSFEVLAPWIDPGPEADDWPDP